MPFGPVILNNTPLVSFWVLDQFELLRSLYGEVIIPDAVLAEFLASEPRQRRRALTHAPWITPVHLNNPYAAAIYAGLDRGESEVRPAVESLLAVGLYFHPAVIAEVLQAVSEETQAE